MDNTLLIGFLLLFLSATCLLVFFIGLTRVMKRLPWKRTVERSFLIRVFLVILTWIGFVTYMSVNGVFGDFTARPPRVPLAVMFAVAAILLFSFSKKGKQLLRATPLHWVIYFQSFRIVVELILLLAHKAGLIPVQMSWEGYNYDVITGIMALPAGYLVQQERLRKPVLVVFNVVGLGLLINIVSIAVFSMPEPFRIFDNEPSSAIVATFPFVYLPTILVVLAAGFHIFSIRQLFLLKKKPIQMATKRQSFELEGY